MRVNHFIQDPDVVSSLRGILINLNSLTATMNDILTDRRGEVTSTIQELEAGMKHLRSILNKIDKGEGTAGRLISDESLYREIEDFVKDLKSHPWKLLKKGSEGGGKKKVLGIF